MNYRVTSARGVSVVSLAIAATAFGLPIVMPGGGFAIGWSFRLAAAWLLISALALSLSSTGRRWLMLLVAPFALFWPAAMLFVLLWAAAFKGGSGFP